MKVRLASIYFAPLRAARAIYNANYFIPAVPRGESPAILEITDKVQHWESSYAMGDGINKRGRVSNLIYGEQIAQDLIKEWSRLGLGMNDKIHPGVWMIREHIPEIDEKGQMITDAMGAIVWHEATSTQKQHMWEEDLAAAREADRLYAEYLISYADGLFQDKRKLSWIPPNARIAANHYGVGRDWSRDIASSNMGPCPFCQKIVSLDAIKCPDCKEVVNVQRYAQLMAEREAAVKLAKREFENVPRKAPSTGMGLKPVKSPFEQPAEEEPENEFDGLLNKGEKTFEEALTT